VFGSVGGKVLVVAGNVDGTDWRWRVELQTVDLRVYSSHLTVEVLWSAL
jgi:hypothetical protein